MPRKSNIKDGPRYALARKHGNALAWPRLTPLGVRGSRPLLCWRNWNIFLFVV